MSQIFRTEFKGYNKNDVTEYITFLNSQLESLKSELDSRDGELARMRAEIEGAQPDSAKEQELRLQIEAELRERLEAELSEKNKASAENGVYVIREELEQLKDRAAMYDSQKEMLAELMINARTDAAQVSAEAQSRSKDILEDTFDKLRRLEGDFDEMKKNVLLSKSEMDTRLNTIRHYLEDFTQYLDVAAKDIENTAQNFKDSI